jgi:cytoskeleton protein RodZ
VGSFGERLQREREMRGITLEEIAEATKIGTRSLRALEAEEFDKLPGGVFNKGFVRSYSRYLGIDEEQAVADYLTAFAEAQAAAREQAAKHEQVVLAVIDEPPAPRLGLGALLVILVIAGLGLGGWRYYAWRKSVSPPQTTVHAHAQPSRSIPAKSPAGSAPSGGSSALAAVRPQTPVPGQAFTVTLHAREDAWVSITADGENVLRDILRASEEKTLHARQQLVIQTGNAGALDLAFNGQPLAAAGDSRRVRTLTFTPQGLQSP